jgi:hypothetical protein
MPLVDVVLGAALVAMRQSFPIAPERPSDQLDAAAIEVVQKGAMYGIELVKKLAMEECNAFAKALR